jgi:hypothetical protein
MNENLKDLSYKFSIGFDRTTGWLIELISELQEENTKLKYTDKIRQQQLELINQKIQRMEDRFNGLEKSFILRKK